MQLYKKNVEIKYLETNKQQTRDPLLYLEDSKQQK